MSTDFTVRPFAFMRLTHEALRAATLTGAQYVGLERDLGSIEVGKLADLAVIEGNPLQDIRVSDRVRYTVLNGRVYDARTMNELGNHPHEREPLWWEREGMAAGGGEPPPEVERGCSCGLGRH